MGKGKDLVVYFSLGFILFASIFVMAIVNYEPTANSIQEEEELINIVEQEEDNFFDSFLPETSKNKRPVSDNFNTPALDDYQPISFRVRVIDEDDIRIGGLKCRLYLPEEDNRLLETREMNDKDECWFSIERKVRYKVEVPLDTNKYTVNKATTIYYHSSTESSAIREIKVGSRPDNEEECSDSDGGINKDVKGRIVGYNNQGIRRDKEDYCYNNPKNAIELYEGEYVAEFYCRKSKHLPYYKTDIENLVFLNFSKCPYGCRDGACAEKEIKTCTESEKEKDYFTYGEGDECSDIDGQMLSEAYCENGETKYIAHLDCDYGCSRGVCLKALPKCIETDSENDRYVKGYVSIDAGETKIYDVCGYVHGYPNNNMLMQTSCRAGKVVMEHDVTCSDGCHNGVCIDDSTAKNEQEGCTDSDGGKNYYYPGVISLKDYKGEDTIYKDMCLGDTLNEYYCPVNEDDKKFTNETYKCPHGCQEGVCLFNCDNKDNVICDEEDSGDKPDFSFALVFNDSEYLYINIGFFNGPNNSSSFDKFFIYFKDSNRSSASKIDVYSDKFKLYWSKEPKSGYYGEFKYSGKPIMISNKHMLKIPLSLILENNPDKLDIWLYSMESKDRVPNYDYLNYTKIN